MHVKFKGRSKEEEEFGGLCMTLYVTPMLPLFSLECDVVPANLSAVHCACAGNSFNRTMIVDCVSDAVLFSRIDALLVWPRSMRTSVRETVECPSVRLSVCLCRRSTAAAGDIDRIDSGRVAQQQLRAVSC